MPGRTRRSSRRRGARSPPREDRRSRTPPTGRSSGSAACSRRRTTCCCRTCSCSAAPSTSHRSTSSRTASSSSGRSSPAAPSRAWRRTRSSRSAPRATRSSTRPLVSARTPAESRCASSSTTRPASRRGRRSSSGSRFDPLAVLGFSASVSGAIGFVAAPSMDSGPIGERAVALAEQFLGVPYTWGGASPLTGFDCSGLAMYVYGELGVSLTHYTGAQILEGTPVPRAELAPGDLVFFEPNAQDVPQHEGIYVGGDRFIQAPHTGDVVKISSLDDPAYALSYVGAVRPYVQ